MPIIPIDSPRTPILCALLVCLLPIACRQNPGTRSVEAPYPALRAVDHLIEPHRVALWMEPFRSSDTSVISYLPNAIALGNDTVFIQPEGPVDISYLRKEGPRGSTFKLSLEPLADNARVTRFHLAWKGSPLGRHVSDARKSLQNLPAYLTNPVSTYGYDIRQITVTDSVFLFSSREIQRSRFAEETRDLYDRLIASAREKGVTYNGVRIFHMEDTDSDKRTIFAGVGIDRPIDTKPEDSVRCKRMPFGHKLLSVDYEGPYNGLPKVLQAIEQYKSDNGMASMANPFHKYMQEGYGFSDSQTLRIRVCYPVY